MLPSLILQVSCGGMFVILWQQLRSLQLFPEISYRTGVVVGVDLTGLRIPMESSLQVSLCERVSW